MSLVAASVAGIGVASLISLIVLSRLLGVTDARRRRALDEIKMLERFHDVANAAISDLDGSDDDIRDLIRNR